MHIKLPSEILAFKLLINANLSKQESMLVLTGVNFAEKKNMYQQTKHSLIKFMEDLTDEKSWDWARCFAGTSMEKFGQQQLQEGGGG